MYKRQEVPGFDSYEFLRTSSNAGGMLLLARQGTKLCYEVWDGDLEDKQDWISSERVWVKFQHGDVMTAVCGVYFRTNNLGKPEYFRDNEELWDVIERESSILSTLGYTTAIIGDLNGHVGNNGPHGIPGNPHGVNRNGELILDFLNRSNMTILNKLSLIHI